MRSRSNAILAENIDEYIAKFDSNIKEKNYNLKRENLLLCYDLINLDYLTLKESNKRNNEYSDFLSANKKYKITYFKENNNNLYNKPLISLKSKKIQKKKRGILNSNSNYFNI